MTATAPADVDTTRTPSSGGTGSASRGLGRGITLGLATAAAALGAAELVAGLARDFASPITVVGNRVIDAAPPALKTFAIERFGTNDKKVLIGTVFVALLVFAAVLGMLSRHHRRWSLAGISLFGVIGVAAALAGVGGFAAAVPSIVGGIVGVFVMNLLADRAWTDQSGGTPAPEPHGGQPAAASRFAAGSRPDPDARVDKNPNNAADAATGRTALHPSRRAFLLTAGAVTAIGVAAAAGGRWARTRFDAAVDRAKVMLPKAKTPLAPIDIAAVSARADGVTPFVTPIDNFYRVDIALEVPQVSIADWKLSVKGMVDNQLSFTYDDLLERDLVEKDVTLTCVSNEVGGQLAGTARWLGVPLAELLEEAGADERADQIVGRSVDGYTCGIPTAAVRDGRTAMVVVGMNGEPLPVIHGFPARLLVAGLYGYVSATKWLKDIELTTFDKFDQYWVPRGYDAKAPIKTFSRIDTPKPLVRVPAGPRVIGGVAWAQTRGIKSVEVRIDGGRWAPAKLADAANLETWRQWFLPTELSSGSHTIECRATDGTGATQPEARSPIRPNGVTGWHSVVVLVE